MSSWSRKWPPPTIFFLCLPVITQISKPQKFHEANWECFLMERDPCTGVLNSVTIPLSVSVSGEAFRTSLT